jgi:hypothetical protein
VNCSARGRAVATAGGTYGTHGRLGHVCSGQIAINPCLPIKLALKKIKMQYIYKVLNNELRPVYLTTRQFPIYYLSTYLNLPTRS